MRRMGYTGFTGDLGRTHGVSRPTRNREVRWLIADGDKRAELFNVAYL